MFDKIKEALKNFAKKGPADKSAVEELIRDIQRTLIQADVDVKLVFDISKKIKDKAFEENLPVGLTRKEHIVNIVNEELTGFLGKTRPHINLGKQKILLVGLFGSGKTTTTSKLGNFFRKKGLKVGLIGCDTFRPAAYQQLKQLADALHIDIYGDPKEKDPVKIVKRGLEIFEKENKKDVIIIDSAGRTALDDELKEEIIKINEVAKPDETLLVLTGDIGQAAKKQTEAFRSAVNLTGVIATRMDSSAKGGGALSACYASGVNVKFIGTGEKSDDFEIYDPVRFVGRLLGMGDLQSLLEKAKEAFEPEQAADMLTGDFGLDTFYKQMEAMKKMGNLSKILDMLPTGGLKMPKEMIDQQQAKMEDWKIIIDSMTKAEKKDPDIIDSDRIKRISKGSGKPEAEIRELIKSFRQMKKMMKKFSPTGGGKMFKRGPMAGLFKKMGM